MNQALNIKNWNDGGNNYILKASAKNKWSGFQQSVITELSLVFGDDFNIVIWTDKQNEDDYYCIPFRVIKHVFTEEHKTKGKYPDRWTAVILNHQFLMHSNSQLAVDISACYAKPLMNLPAIEVTDDFFIENAKAEISIRLGQSKFRKGVLKNFGYKCALSGISDVSLLTASHIIPWAHKKECRGDVSNGICLYVEYDALFDQGFISLTDELEIVTTSGASKLSNALQERLELVKGKKLIQPVNRPLNREYLNYHRTKIFKR